ncbi:phosphoribulokinase/uridine kinase, partial [Tribonema minus]
QYWVALAGAPGAGKTTVCAGVAAALLSRGVGTAVVGMDGFHLYRRELDAMPDPAEAHRKRGAHWTFDAPKFLQRLREVRANGRGAFPSFDHCVGDPVEDDIVVGPEHQVVIVEGNYLLLSGDDASPWNEIRPLFDQAWFLDCPESERRLRLVKRHMLTGLSKEAAELRTEDNDLPNGAFIVSHLDRAAVDRVISS